MHGRHIASLAWGNPDRPCFSHKWLRFWRVAVVTDADEWRMAYREPEARKLGSGSIEMGSEGVAGKLSGALSERGVVSNPPTNCVNGGQRTAHDGTCGRLEFVIKTFIGVLSR